MTLPNLMVGRVLHALDRDIALHPERLQPFPPELQARVQSLVGDMDVDLDAPLPPDGEQTEAN